MTKSHRLIAFGLLAVAVIGLWIYGYSVLLKNAAERSSTRPEPQTVQTAPVVYTSPQPEKRTPTDLEARVNFNGTQFTITNEGKEDWLDLRCTLNPSGILRNGYDYRIKRLEAGKAVQVGAMHFAKSDGTRFNPFQTKPLSMSCRAKIDTLSGPEAFFLGSWQ